MAVFWAFPPSSVLEVHKGFRGACCLLHQGGWLDVNFGAAMEVSGGTSPTMIHRYRCQDAVLTGVLIVTCFIPDLKSYTKCSIFSWSIFTLDVVAIGTPIVGRLREGKKSEGEKTWGGGETRIKNQIDINSFLYLAVCFIELRCAQRRRRRLFLRRCGKWRNEDDVVTGPPATAQHLCTAACCFYIAGCLLLSKTH